MLDASGSGWAVTVFVARQAEGPASCRPALSRRACRGWQHRRNEKRDETVACGLRGLETGRDSAGAAKLVRDSQGRQRAVLSWVRPWRVGHEALQRDTCRMARGGPGAPENLDQWARASSAEAQPLTLL